MCPGFNPRPREGGDPPPPDTSAWSPVSIHAPARGATFMDEVGRIPDLFQSTPPRGGRPGGSFPTTMTVVSIHAPARGATFDHERDGSICAVSIHAPARGATRLALIQYAADRFNPRPREGGDDIPCAFARFDPLFQSTPPRGGRPSPLSIQPWMVVSIHAPARGATLRLHFGLEIVMFQSTPPRGGRLLARGREPLLVVSIHAPARGATPLRPPP